MGTPFTSHRSLLEKRYPQLALYLLAYLTSHPYKAPRFVSSGEKKNVEINVRGVYKTLYNFPIEKELKRWHARLKLEESDILYVYGIGLGYSYELLQEWLRQKPARALVFIEDSISIIEALLHMPKAGELLEDPQVHLYFVFIPEKETKASRQWGYFEQVLQECTRAFSSDRITCAALPLYTKVFTARWKKIRLTLLRFATVFSALSQEAFYGYRLLANLYPNFQRLPEAFCASRLQGCFQGIPAVVCGAGPSLNRSLAALKKWEQKGLIIAGGSTVAALSSQGILPHFAMAFDPNPEEWERFKKSSAFEVPLLYGNRLHPDVFMTCNGPWGYLSSGTGGAIEHWLEEKLGIGREEVGLELGREAFSVTTLAVAFARTLGCNPIILVGVDLAYTDGKRYASGIVAENLIPSSHDPRAGETQVPSKDHRGNPVTTLVKWVMESSVIGQYAALYPETRFINATEGGIGIPGIPYSPLDGVLQEYAPPMHDLRGMIHCEISQRFFPFSSQDVTHLLTSFTQSLTRMQKIAQAMLGEIERVLSLENPHIPTGKMALLELEWEEEEAFCSLETLGAFLEQITDRYAPLIPEEKQDLKRLLAKWTAMQEAVKEQLGILGQTMLIGG